MENHIEVEETSSKRDKGFTLVELLIVIVILGILATVTVFAVRGITDKGKTSACQADQKTLETAVEAWFALPATVDLNIPPTAATSDDTAKDTVADGYPSQAELVTVKLIRAASKNYDVQILAGATATQPAGSLFVPAGSTCPTPS